MKSIEYLRSPRSIMLLLGDPGAEISLCLGSTQSRLKQYQQLLEGRASETPLAGVIELKHYRLSELTGLLLAT